MSCDEIRELLEPYVLGVVEDDERARVEAHLAGCDECRGLVDDYESALAGLPDALALASPLPLPASLKRRLERTLAAEATPPAAPQPTIGPRSHIGRQMLVLAGAVVIVLSIAATAALSLALDRERSLREKFGGLLDDREIVVEIVDSRETTRAVLLPPGRDSRTYGKLFTNSELRDVVVMAARLTQPGDGEVYRLWLAADGRTRSPGTLELNERGFGLLLFKAEHAGPSYDAARVVLQRDDARTPAGRVVLAWSRAP